MHKDQRLRSQHKTRGRLYSLLDKVSRQNEVEFRDML